MLEAMPSHEGHEMLKLFILEGREVVQAESTITWGRWFETHPRQRIVAQTKLIDGRTISTVFIGIPAGLSERGGLFETAILAPNCSVLNRYDTWAQAEVGHMEVVEAHEHLLPKENHGTATP